MARYSDARIAELAAGNYKDLSKYEQRLVRGFNRGLPRDVARGHAKVKELSIARNPGVSPVQRGTGKVASAAKKIIAPLGFTQKNMYRKSDTKRRSPIGKIINAATASRLEKQIMSTPDSARLWFNLRDRKNGLDVKLFGHGRKASTSSMMSAGELKERVQSKMQDKGYTFDEAFYEVLDEDFDAYEDDEYTTAPTSPTNYIMYVNY